MCPRSIAGVLPRGTSELPYYCTSPVCVPDVIGGLAAWRHNNQKKRQYVGWSMHFEAHTCRLQAHSRSGYMGATVSSAGVCLLKYAPLAAPMWLCTPILGVSGDLVHWKMDLAAIGWARLAATHWVSMGKLSARRSNALATLLPGAGPLCAGADNVDADSNMLATMKRTGEPTAVIRQHGKAFDMLSWLFGQNTTRRHQIWHPDHISAPYPNTCTFCHLFTFDIMLFYLYTHHVPETVQGTLHMHAQHRITTHPHSQEFLISSPCQYSFIKCMFIQKAHAFIEMTWLFTKLLLRAFVFRFCCIAVIELSLG